MRRSINKSIGKRLKAARETSGLTLMKLGRKSEIHWQAISHYENGRRIPSVKNLTKLCKALKVSIDYTITGDY